jgi:hypothetical protein
MEEHKAERRGDIMEFGRPMNAHVVVFRIAMEFS